MKVNKVVGIDIGNYRMKVSYVVKGQLKKFFCENVPDNSVKDGMIQYWDAMAQFLRDTFKEHEIRCRNVIFNVPMNGIYIRKVELPLMTIKQLELNLPFEFHDYIAEDSSKYFYDYSVIDRDEKSMNLLAVACSKELISKYRKLARDAKLNPIGLVPGVIGLQRILQKHNQHFSVPDDKDYAILDMGDNSFKIHFFKHGIYDVTRSLEPGAREFAEMISEINDTDIHISHLAEEDNLNNIQSHPKLVQIYENRAVEIMRALNFYSYSNTGNTIDTLYYCGGASNILKLIKTLSETLNLPVTPLSHLVAIMDDEIRNSFRTCPQSFGITIDPEVIGAPLPDDKLKQFNDYISEYERKEKEAFDKEDVAAQDTLEEEINASTISSDTSEYKAQPEVTAVGAPDEDSSLTQEETIPTLTNDSTDTTSAYTEVSDSAAAYGTDNASDLVPSSTEENTGNQTLADTSSSIMQDTTAEETDNSAFDAGYTDEQETFHLDDSDDTVHRIDGKDEEYSDDEFGSAFDEEPQGYHTASSEDIKNVEDDTNKTIEELTAQIMNGHFDL